MPDTDPIQKTEAPAGQPPAGAWQRWVSELKARVLRWTLRWCAAEFVHEIYSGILQREPDAEGLAAYTKELQTEGNLAGVLKSFVDSEEHRRKMFASHVPEMVKAAYVALLAREPDVEGNRAHGAFLASSQDLTALLVAVTESPEFKQKQLLRIAPELVKGAYQAMLERDPDADELVAGSVALSEDRDLGSTLKRLVNLEEFQRKVLASRMPAVVRGAYAGLLGREPEPEGERAHSAFLAATLDFAAFFTRIYDSAEFKQRNLSRFAQNAPQAAANAPALDAPQAPAATNGQQSGECPECQADFNEEFLDRPNTPRTVRAAFCLILGRPAAPADVEAQLRVKTARQLRFALMDSHEFRQRMTRLFPTKLPTAAEIDAVKTAFIHIPKTGGTTMHELLRPLFEHDRICPERYDGLHCYKAGDLARFQLFSGHFSLESCDLIPGPKRIFTMLRRPLDRLLSHYKFAKSHAAELVQRDQLWKLVHEHDMRGFFSLERVRIDPSINNTMVRVMARAGALDSKESKALIESDFTAMGLLEAAKQNLRSLLTFGVLERYDESVDLIFRTLGLKPPAKIEPKNVLKDLAGKVKGLKQLEPQIVGPEEMEAIAPLIGADAALYDYGVQLFEENLKAFAGK